MAIAFDAATDGSVTVGSSTHTFSHTCSGSNRLLFVWAFGGLSSGSFDITGVTYAGVSMTEIARKQCTADRWAALYYLVAPATGANNVVVSVSGTVCAGSAVSYTGASQAGVPDASTTFATSGLTSSLTVNLTSNAANCWFLLAVKNQTGQNMTAGSGATERLDSASSGVAVFDSNSAQAAGAYSMSATILSDSEFAAVMVSFAPDTGGDTLMAQILM